MRTEATAPLVATLNINNGDGDMGAIEHDFTCIDQPGKPPLFLIDQDITFDLGYAKQSAHARINTFIAEEREAAIFKRLLKTRKNNKRARAYPELPGVFE